MTSERASALDALEAFWRVVRQHTEQNPDFALELVKELKIPIRIEIDTTDLKTGMAFLDPIHIAGQGYDEFRRVFRPMSDANMRKIIVNFGIAPKERVSSKGPKGEELFKLLWDGALVRRNQ